jgi:4-amino-4-deoxy-L-arabinose transferase-like glycosyltransferase
MKDFENGDNWAKNKVLIIVCVFLLAATMAVWNIRGMAMENHECFVSITAREMLSSGNWVIPTCNGELRIKKTPLSYWLVAGLAKITGNIDEFTVRFPSAVFAVLSAMAIMYFVNRWLGFRLAAICACVWATSFGYINYSHNARPEMALTFFVTLCFLSFYSATNEKNRKKQIIYAVVFWISLGLGNLAKGPVPLPLVLIPLACYVAVFREWKILPKMLPVIGPVIFLAIVLPWLLAVAQRLNWDLTAAWKRETMDRFMGEYASGNYPIYFYLLIIFSFIAPWVAFVPVALITPFYKVWDQNRKTMLFLWFWFIADLIFLTVSGGKRKHYILPAMPALAVLISTVMEDMIFVCRVFKRKFARDFLVYHIIIITIIAVAGTIYIAAVKPEFLSGLIPLSIGGPLLIGVTGAAFGKKKTTVGCSVLFAGYCVLIMICYANFLNPFNNDKYTKVFALQIAERIPKTDRLIAYNYVSMRVVHYFGQPIPVIKDKSLLYQDYDRGDWVVATDKDLQELEKDGRFTKVYLDENAEVQKKANIRGALFHKSVTVPII